MRRMRSELVAGIGQRMKTPLRTPSVNYFTEE